VSYRQGSPAAVAAIRYVAIATFDQRHFRVIRPLTPHSNFHLLPDDVPDS
jgi:hypothetical protein